MSKISGPLMDRIDIQIDVPAVPYKELSNSRSAESSEIIRTRVFQPAAFNNAASTTTTFTPTRKWDHATSANTAC